MSRLNEFLHMGGYAFYVWTSYGIALVVLLATALSPIRQRRKLLSGIARSLRRNRVQKT
jgi:heme exporter protein D